MKAIPEAITSWSAGDQIAVSKPMSFIMFLHSTGAQQGSGFNNELVKWSYFSESCGWMLMHDLVFCVFRNDFRSSLCVVALRSIAVIQRHCCFRLARNCKVVGR